MSAADAAGPGADGHTLVVVLASAGRPALIADVLDDLARQTRRPDRVVLAVPDEASAPPGARERCTVVLAERGLAAQRNAGLAAAPEADVVAFFDDDAVLEPHWLERALAHFDDDASLVGLTGAVLLDGASRGTIDAGLAAEVVAHADLEEAGRATTPIRGLYGCNFAVRRVPGMPRFDERLPLYSWLEDRDFSHRLQGLGSTVRAPDCMIVHLGAASGGRLAHTRLGYTQVMNPVYFLVKRSFFVRETVWEAGHLLAINAVRSVAGPERRWRRRRLAGNVLALRDVLRGRIQPERMLDHR